MKRFSRLLTFILVMTFLSSSVIGCAAENNTVHRNRSDIMTDISAEPWYAEAVSYCLSNGIIDAASEDAFLPHEPMRRGDTAMAFWRMAGSPSTSVAFSFQDAADDTRYVDAVRWVAEASVMSGYSDSAFGTGDPLTREQMAAILYRYDQYVNGISADASAGNMNFSDSQAISDWAIEAVRWAVKITKCKISDLVAHDSARKTKVLAECRASFKEIISGRPGGLFAPKDTVSRAEAAVMLYRYLQRDIKDADAEEETMTDADVNRTDSGGITTVDISIGTQIFTATFYDHETAQALIAQMPLTVTMSDLNRNEKYFHLAEDLPSSGTERPPTIQEGDIMCWSGNSLVLFYKTFSNSYGGYVRLGYINDTDGLAASLGTGEVTVTFTIFQ